MLQLSMIFDSPQKYFPYETDSPPYYSDITQLILRLFVGLSVLLLLILRKESKIMGN